MGLLGNAQSAYALGQTQISLPDGRTVKLADLGEVKDMFAEQRSVAKMAGREVLSIGISKAKGSSDVTVYPEVRKVLDELNRDNPDVASQELLTSVVYLEQQYESALPATMECTTLSGLVEVG